MKLKNIPSYIIIIAALIFMFPLYWMVVGSFKDMSNLFDAAKNLLPSDFKYYNYVRLFTKNPVMLWFLNSIIVASISTVIILLTNTMAGYSLAKKQFYGNKIIFWVIMGTLMLPRQVLIVPMYITMKNLDLIGKFPSIMLPAIGWPIGIFLMKQFMQTLPNEIIESSTIDGCSELGIFFRMVVPLTKPGIGALAIFSFIGVWNDYLWQLIIISKGSMMTLPLGIASLQTEFVPDYGVLFSGATIAAVPMIIIFMIFQKYFTKGITLGAVKG